MCNMVYTWQRIAKLMPLYPADCRSMAAVENWLFLLHLNLMTNVNVLFDVYLQNVTEVKHCFGSYTLLTVPTAAVEDYLLRKQKGETECGVVKAISGHSDLLEGQYEG